MTAFTLLAKSDGFGRRRQSIREHTEAVIKSGERLVEVTGVAQLVAVGLDPLHWLDRFRREIKLAALLHDLGKANDHFQEMLAGRAIRGQGLRHEAVSFLIARQPEVRNGSSRCSATIEPSSLSSGRSQGTTGSSPPRPHPRTAIRR
ncbi:CRISPR-associated endonuclease Cas3'' [Singulisphaera sp. Ch08]|uniref:CRISPR-associated endonuclease Cas3 n=1 Tax=Singulisphaera sp. Ch08 TaxID=3120278 RepID=A0AAU7CIQ7_9BACT